MGLQKNTASQKWLVFAFNITTNAKVTGDAAQITAKIRKDFGAAGAVTDTNPTEIEDGYYEFDLTQAETNANVLDLLPESSTGSVQVIGVPGRIFTVPANFQTLGIESDGDLTKVNTLDGHTAQTGDSFAIVNSGTHGNAAILARTPAAGAITNLNTVYNSAFTSYFDTGTMTHVSKLANISSHGGAAAEIRLAVFVVDAINAFGGGETAIEGVLSTVTDLTNAATNGDLTATMKASVNTEADQALADYDGPTSAEMVARTLAAAAYATAAAQTTAQNDLDLIAGVDGVLVSTVAKTEIHDALLNGAGTINISGGAVSTVATVTDKTGYALTGAERTAIADQVELQIIDETDSEKVLEAVVNKINAMTDLDALTLAAIAAAIRAELAAELARLDVAISSRLAAAGYTAPPSAAAVAGQTRVELSPELAELLKIPRDGTTYRWTNTDTLVAADVEITAP